MRQRAFKTWLSANQIAFFIEVSSEDFISPMTVKDVQNFWHCFPYSLQILEFKWFEKSVFFSLG